MKLQDKVIAITGGGRGIGRAIAVRLGQAGARIALLDLNDADMAETARQVQAAGSEARAYHCNIAEEALVEATFNQIVADFGGIHGLVNNAGVLRDKLLIKVKDGQVVDKMTADEYDFVTSVHMKGAFLCAREAACHMATAGVEDGCIVNMSSMAGGGNFGQTNYAAAKAGMRAQSNTWAKELGRYNIRSNTIAPGTIATDMLMSMPAEAREKLASLVPLRRIGDVENVAQAVQQCFENDYLNGAYIEVGGGLVL